MTTTSKILLIVAVAMFAAGVTSWGSSLGYGLLKPLAAVLVIVVFMLELLPHEPSHTSDAPTGKPDAQPQLHEERAH